MGRFQNEKSRLTAISFNSLSFILASNDLRWANEAPPLAFKLQGMASTLGQNERRHGRRLSAGR
jgi:hypothetical protein